MKRTIAVALVLALTLALCPVGVLAADVPAGWAQKEIALAEEAGLITPRTQGIYTAATTRLQFAELIVNLTEKLLGYALPAAPADTFDDCDDEAVLKAYRAGIVNGMSKTPPEFRPQLTTNREQIATMIHRMLTYYKEQTGKNLLPRGADLTGFEDVDQLASWSKEAVGILAANDVMKGTSSTRLSPKSDCQVQMSILLIWRLYDKATNPPEPDPAETVMYADFPLVPDFGAFAGVEPASRQENYGDYEALFQYAPTDQVYDAVMGYLDLLAQCGFRISGEASNDNAAALFYRYVNDKGLMVSLQVHNTTGVAILIDTNVPAADPPKELRFYAEFPAVPDFGAATGELLSEKDFSDGILACLYTDTSLSNDEVYAKYDTYAELLFDHGFYYYGSADIDQMQFTDAFLPDDEGIMVTVSFSEKIDGEYYWFITVGPNNN